MPAEMTPLEAAEIMEESARQAKCMIDAPTTFFSAASQSAGVERVKKCEMAYSLAASYLRAVAAGELRPVIHGRWIYKDCNGVQTMPNEMTAGEAEGKPMYDSLGDIIKALEAMYNSEKFIRKADYWARCAGEAASILRRVAAGGLAEVVHGHWKETARYEIQECSLCGHSQYGFSKHCPNCGALMDGKDDSHA